NLDGVEYWEAWQVVNGVVYSGARNGSGSNLHREDLFQTAREGDGRKGLIAIKAEVKFVEDYILTMPPWGHIQYAGDLPAIRNLPGWTAKFTQIHSLMVIFN